MAETGIETGAADVSQTDPDTSDSTLEVLWMTGTVERRFRPERSDERDMLTEAVKGRSGTLGALLARHASDAWRFAAVNVLDAEEATEISIDAWSQIVEHHREVLGAPRPFRAELLRRVRALAVESGGTARPDLDLTTDCVPVPFSAAPDPTYVSQAFVMLSDEDRAGLWLRDVECIAERDVVTLLDQSSMRGRGHLESARGTWLANALQAQVQSATGRCSSTVGRFRGYLSDSLIDTDVDVLHRHLRACPTCTARLDAFEDPVGVLLDRVAPVPPDLGVMLIEHLTGPLQVARFS